MKKLVAEDWAGPDKSGLAGRQGQAPAQFPKSHPRTSHTFIHSFIHYNHAPTNHQFAALSCRNRKERGGNQPCHLNVYKKRNKIPFPLVNMERVDIGGGSLTNVLLHVSLRVLFGQVDMPGWRSARVGGKESRRYN